MISGTTRSSGPYAGNGVQTSFPITFDFFDDVTLIRVLEKVTSDDEDHGTALTYTTHFTVVGTNVVAVTAPAAGKEWIIELNMPFTQLYEYISGGVFPQADHETNLDRIYRTIQQILDMVERAPLVSAFETIRNLKLPVPRDGYTLVGNEDEDGWREGPTEGQIEDAESFATAAKNYRDSALNYANDSSSSASDAEDSATAAAASAAAAAASVASVGSAKAEVVVGVYAAGNTTFTLGQTPTSIQAVMFFLSKAIQIPTTDFSLAANVVTVAGVDVSAEEALFFYRY